MNILTKRIGSALLMGVLPLLIACQRHSKSESFYLIATNIKHAYWQSAWAGFSKAADEYGVTADMRGPDGFDPEDEVTEFRDAVALKPSGILVQVGNEALMRPEIDAAVAAGIPVITIDSDAPASHRLFFIGTNNLQAGRLGGARVAAQLKGKGNVVFFTIAGQPNLEERLKGYKDALAGYPGIKVADVFDMRATRAWPWTRRGSTWRGLGRRRSMRWSAWSPRRERTSARRSNEKGPRESCWWPWMWTRPR